MRRLNLGSGAASNGIEANLKDGILNITIPKLDGKASSPVKIQVD